MEFVAYSAVMAVCSAVITEQTDQRKELLLAIQGLREGRITETAESYSYQPG